MLRKVELSGNRLAMAEHELGPVEAAAMVAAWLIRSKPFPERNVEIGYRCMLLMLKEAGLPWPRPEQDADRISRMLNALEAGLISEARFAEWVCLRVATA